MPLGKRRKSVQGDGNVKECIGNRMIVDQKDDVSEDKTTKGGNKVLDSSSDRTAVQPSQTPANVSSQTSEKKTGHIGAVTRSRVVKRPKRDLSPPESPVKKSSKEVKTNTPETKTKRQWELWSTEDKATFFEGLYEHGKDFDAIQNVIAQKCKKKGVAPQLIKNKDQVRHFYYRTWHKICKYIQIEDVKKETAELYGLINYGVLWKKYKAALTEKNGLKLDELVHTGSTTIKLKGKNLRIKTPCCTALKKLNNIDDSKTDTDPREKLPERILVDFSPLTNSAWSFVQEMSQNPRLRILMKPQRKLSSVIRFMSKKWKPHRLRLKEELEVGNDLDKDLTVFPHQECDINPITLKATKVPKVHLDFNHYQKNVLSSPSVTKGKKNDTMKLQCDNSSEISNQAVIFDSPRASKVPVKDGPSGQSTVSGIDICALAEGDNAMFPDDLMSSSGVSDSGDKPSQLSCDEVANCDKTASPVHSVSEIDNCVSAESDKSPESDVDDKETQKMQELITKGWTKHSADNVTIAELYLMFGKDGKVRLEYDWRVTEENLAAKLTNMLRRLVHLAATEFSDFSKTTSTNSPCHSCGVVRSRAGARNDTGAKGQKTLGRYPLTSKMGEAMVDVGTQTQGSMLQNDKSENASQGKDAVFRVPVASPAFLQKSTKPLTNQISLSQMELLSNSHKTRRMRTVNRKPMVVQRTLLPKACPRQMFTFVPSVGQVPPTQTIIGQPVGIPVNLATSGVPTNVIKVPNSNMSGNNLRLITNAPTGAESRLPVPPSNPSSATVLPLSVKTVVSQQMTSVSAMSPPIPVVNATVKTSPTLSVSTTASTLIQGAISPPSISSLLDMSLSNLPTGDPDGTDKFLDLALENSNNFGSLLDTAQDKPSSSVLNTPVKSANIWINGEDTGDMSFMNLLSDSPLKKSTESSSNVNSLSLSGLLPSSTFFCENSRDSMMGRLDLDMQSMMNENSIDYVAKFADLAAHITQNDNTGNQPKKCNTAVHALSDSLSRFDELTNSVCVTPKKTDSKGGVEKLNSLEENDLIVNGKDVGLTKSVDSDMVCDEDEKATMKLIEISATTEIMDSGT